MTDLQAEHRLILLRTSNLTGPRILSPVDRDDLPGERGHSWTQEWGGIFLFFFFSARILMAPRQRCTLLLTITLVAAIVALLQSDAARSAASAATASSTRAFWALGHQGAPASVACTTDAAHPDVAALFVFYDKPHAAIAAISAYRAAYPATRLYLACDDGCLNFSGVAAHFNATYDGRAHRISSKLPGASFHLLVAEAHTFIRMIGAALEGMREEFFLILETDVRVERRIESPLRYDINGYAPDKSVVGGAERFARNHNGNTLPTIPLAGIGGSILRTSFFRALAAHPGIHAAIDELFAEAQTEFRGRTVGNGNSGLGEDYVFSSLTQAFNGTIGTYSGYVEDKIDVHSVYMKMLGTVEVLHNFKALYGSPVTPADEAVLGPHWEERLRVGSDAASSGATW